MRIEQKNPEQNGKRRRLPFNFYIAGLIVILAGCGFQPAKPLDVNDQWSPIYFKARDSLGYELQRELQIQGVHTRKVSEAKSEIQLANIDLEQQNLSVTSDGRNAEFLMILTVDTDWKLVNTPAISTAPADTDVVQPSEAASILKTSVVVESSFIANPLNPSAESAERELVSNRLEKRLVKELIRRMSLLSQPVIRPQSDEAQKPTQ